MLCPAGKLGSFYGRVAERLRQINHCRFDSCPVHERMFFYMVYSPAARRNVGRRFWDRKILKAMGAKKDTASRKVSFEYNLQDGFGTEYTIGVTAIVEANFADENGGSYPPNVWIENAAWQGGRGTTGKNIDPAELPARMRAMISAQAVDLAYSIQ